MDKEYFLNNLQKLFKHKKFILNEFQSQIEEFFKVENLEIDKRKYKIGDDVLLDKYCLIHGTNCSFEELKNISQNGLISPEFFSGNKYPKKKPYVSEFWKIGNESSLKEFIDYRCGMTFEVTKGRKIILSEFVPMKDVEKKVMSISDYRCYSFYQNQEQRFVPNKYTKFNKLAFILRYDDRCLKLLDNEYFNENFNKKLAKKLLPDFLYRDQIVKRQFTIHETGRERAVLFGVPSNLIEGILVNEDLENNKEELNNIIKIFPNLYICNINGKVIL